MSSTSSTAADAPYPGEDRLAHDRARYIEATTTLRATEADALAWSELGYSTSGIAKQIDSSASTVSTYLSRAVAAYGPAAAHARRDVDVERDLSPVTADDVVAWPPAYRDVWRDAAERHPERTPDDLALGPEVER